MEDWNLQVSYKLPSGALINVRGTTDYDLKANIEVIASLAADILATEQTLLGVATVGGALPLSQQQPQSPAAPLPAPPSPSSQAPVGYSSPSQPAPFPQGPSGAAAPPQQWQQPQAAGAQLLCKHGVAAKVVPAGVSKSTGKPYRSFAVCSMDRANDCGFRQTL